MKKRIIALIVIFSFVLPLITPISVNAYYYDDDDNLSEQELNKIANAQTVYLDKVFNVKYEPNNDSEESTSYYSRSRSFSYYKINVGNNKLSMIDIKTDASEKDLEDFTYSYEVLYLDKGRFTNAVSLPRASGSVYVLDKNKVYYLRCYIEKDVNVTLHNISGESVQLKKSNKGTITKNFEKLYKFKTNGNNYETILKAKYAGEGATLKCYIIGLDKDNNAFVRHEFGGWHTTSDIPYSHNVYAKNREHYVFISTDLFTVPTNYTLSWLSGPESKKIEKAKYKKKYKGNTFGFNDSYTYKLKPYYKTKLKVEITGKNVVVDLNKKKIKCKKKVTKTIWVEPMGESLLDTPTYLYVDVYKKGQKYSEFNENGSDYTLKITKLKTKKR